MDVIVICVREELVIPSWIPWCQKARPVSNHVDMRVRAVLDEWLRIVMKANRMPARRMGAHIVPLGVKLYRKEPLSVILVEYRSSTIQIVTGIISMKLLSLVEPCDLCSWY